VISKLAIALLLITFLAALPIRAQRTDNDAESPALQRRCTTVALVSDTPLIPYRLIALYLQRRSDFQAANLVLSDDPSAADAGVQLHKGESGYTRIQITNRLTGQQASMVSEWTDYPGMVAMDVMQQLKAVCAALNVASAPSSFTAPCGDPTLMRPGRSLAACSHTSWMDNREIYEALNSREELTQRSVQLLPACGGAGTMLDITHDLDRTAEWNWRLRSAQGQIISEGMVIAASSRSAAARIAEDALRDVPGAPANQQTASVSQCFTQPELEAFLHPRPNRSFKHVMGRAAFYAGEGIAATAIVSAYAAWYAAMGIGMSMAMSGY
jgi:hypothetical protein